MEDFYFKPYNPGNSDKDFAGPVGYYRISLDEISSIVPIENGKYIVGTEICFKDSARRSVQLAENPADVLDALKIFVPDAVVQEYRNRAWDKASGSFAPSLVMCFHTP